MVQYCSNCQEKGHNKRSCQKRQVIKLTKGGKALYLRIPADMILDYGINEFSKYTITKKGNKIIFEIN